MIGGIPEAKQWIGHLDPAMIQVPFPDGFRNPYIHFDGFLKAIADAGIDARNVAGVISETYQGGSAAFAPPAYFQAVRQWCDEHEALLTFDEVQASFGRTGTLFSFEHYEVVPDLLCLGKGVGGALPLSAVVGRATIMDQYGPLAMTQTHGGNPVCAASALANIDLIINDKLAENSARVGELLHQELWKQLKPYDRRIGAIQGKGLCAGIHLIKDESNTPDAQLAHDITWHAVGRGLMLFAPVGVAMASLKLCPPLCITPEATIDGVKALADAFADCLTK
jgi:4-aminobutyrate aminotransferase-like enzyme